MLWRSKATATDKPFRDELLSIERLEERALALAASFTIDPSPQRRGPRKIFPRFHDNARALRSAYRTLAEDVRIGSRDVRRRMAARQLPPDHVRDP
jgi:cyclic beta-1,2-glucan synthetase